MTTGTASEAVSSAASDAVFQDDGAPLLARWDEQLRGRGLRVGLADGGDDRALEAASRLGASGVIRPVLVGDAAQIRTRAEQLAVTLDDDTVWDIRDALSDPDVRHALEAGLSRRPADLLAASRDPLYVTAAALRCGALDAGLGGASRPTADVLRAGLRIVGLRAGVRVLSSAFLMLLPDSRLLTFSDCAVVPDPNEAELVDIAVAAASTHSKLTSETPVVAMLSFSTQGSADHPSVGKVRTAARRLRALESGPMVDGELQFDAALIDSVGRLKAPESDVAGHANVLVFPNLDAGNIGYKIAERLGGAIALGPILQGLDAPINDLSRGCSSRDIEIMARLTAVQSLL